jgi:cyclase
MNSVRVIPRLDIKGPNLVKCIHLEGLRVIGDPKEYAKRYYEAGADEILFVDIVASLYRRNSILDLVQAVAKDVFIPMTVGGGLRTIEDIRQALRAGADKVAINTAAVQNPAFLREAVQVFGSQCIVLNVEYMMSYEKRIEVFTDCAREKTNLLALDWIKQALDLGVGEILLASIEKEGTGLGYDLDFIATVTEMSPVPVIAFGGAGNAAHVIDAVKVAHADAVSMAGILHYNKTTLPTLKHQMAQAGIPVREEVSA